MKRLAIALLASALMTAPALAQQSQGNNNLGNVLQELGRSLSGQSNPPPNSGNYQSTYQQTYNNSLQQYRSENNQQLQQDDQRLSEAWNQLRAASQALDQEMSRRGMRTGNNNQTGPNGPNGGNYSGSSTYGNYSNGPAPYNGPNGPYNGSYNRPPNGGYNGR